MASYGFLWLLMVLYFMHVLWGFIKGFPVSPMIVVVCGLARLGFRKSWFRKSWFRKSWVRKGSVQEILVQKIMVQKIMVWGGSETHGLENHGLENHDSEGCGLEGVVKGVVVPGGGWEIMVQGGVGSEKGWFRRSWFR